MLNIALDCIRRGWHVFPCIPRTKEPLAGLAPNGVKNASNDEATIRRWWTVKPAANVAIACVPSGITVVDCDHGHPDETSARAWIERAGLPRTYTVRTGRRFDPKNPDVPEYGIQAYFIGAEPTRDFDIAGGKGEIRGTGKAGAYVMAVGSVHDRSGERYELLIDAPLAPLPAFVREWNPKPKTENVGIGDGNLDWLLSFLETNNVAVRSGPREVEGGFQLEIVCPWVDEHSSESGRDTVVGVFNGRYGFNCKHGHCLSRRWQDFKDKVKTPLPTITFGGNRKPKTSSVYPINAWDDTVVAEYAKLCADDNNVPLALYAEAFRCALGAVLGDRLVCPDVDGANPRTYTVLIAPFGKGKGTAVDRAVDFFSATWESKSLSCTPGFLSGSPLFTWKPFGLGAWKASANSIPGMARLLREPKNIGMKPHMAWRNTLPRIFSVHEEMKSLLSALFIEGGTGSGLGGVICQLWDRPSFFGGATGNRDAQFGEMLFSMLCGVTPDDWDDLLSHGDVVGGGLFSRLNIVSTDGNYANVGTMKPPDFTLLRESFLPRIAQLQDAPARVHASDAARSIIGEWTRTLPDGSQRMNIHVWRTALLLAWLRRESAITERTAEDSVALGRYQIDQHALFKPQQADNALARVQNNIVAVLKRKGPLGRGRLQDFTHAQRAGTELWSRALDGLLREGLVGKQEDGRLLIV